MKKIISVILLITILCINLSSCIIEISDGKSNPISETSNNKVEKKYKKIALNANNYRDYFSYVAYTKDGSSKETARYYSNNTLTIYYTRSWTSVVEVFPTRGNCTFENVRLLALGDFIDISLDAKGYAKVQKSIVESNRPYSYIPSTPDFTICIVEGYVYVYED